MKHVRFASALLAGSVALTGCADEITPTAPAAAPPAAYVTGSAGASITDQHLAVFESGIPAHFAASVEAAGGSVVAAYDQVGIAVVRGLSADAATALRAHDGIIFLDADPTIEMDPLAAAPEAADVGVAGHAAGNPADAHRFSWQWHLRAIGADRAWAAGHYGSSDVTVAIIDTGLDYLHADLAGRVDLSRSRSYLSLDDSYTRHYFPGRHLVSDLQYHGTHVGATVVSNGIAAAGVTRDVTLMGLKVCSAVVRGCSGAGIVQALMFAADNGADVINMSLGGSFNKSDYPGYISSINRVINYVNTKNVTLVVSAGNSNLDLDHDKDGYKTYCSATHVICVSATGPTDGARDADGRLIRTGPWYDIDAKAGYSNYGRSAISVAAPGGNSGGSVWAACSTSSLHIPVCQRGGFIVGIGGTSMASPHVSGLAALMVERYGKNPARVKNAIQKSADDLGQKGTDPIYGKGRINVANAVGVR